MPSYRRKPVDRVEFKDPRDEKADHMKPATTMVPKKRIEGVRPVTSTSGHVQKAATWLDEFC